MVNEVSNNCNHKKLNRKAQQLIKKGNYQEAFALYSEYIPYFHFDEDDKKACIILSDIYEHYFENEYESQRLRNIGRDSNCDLIKFMNDNPVFSKDMLLLKNSYYIDLLSILYINNRFTETAIVYSVCTYLDICIPEQLDKLILKQDSIMKFTQQITDTSDLWVIAYQKDNIFDRLLSFNLSHQLKMMNKEIEVICIESNEGSIDRISANSERYFSKQEFVDFLCGIPNTNLICNRLLYSKLSKLPVFYKKAEILSRNIYRLFDSSIECFSFGNYDVNMLKKYGYSIYENLKAYENFEFSIVIPVRNSCDYLSSTIKTCLCQTSGCTYEVLISDNSDIEDTRVKALVEEIADSRIRYIRTPEVLPLTKSFEFAILNARGSNIVALGADDGLCNNALDVLNEYFKSNPQSDIVMFQRAYYIWHNPENGVLYSTDKRFEGVKKVLSKDLFEMVIKRYDETFLDLPLMYLNTCFKRQYLNSVMMKTGRIYDGFSQDIYMGVLNLFIKDSFDLIGDILIICGTSEVSFGLNSNKVVKNETQFKKKILEYGNDLLNTNYFNSVTMSLRIPPHLSDKALLISEYFKIMQLGIETPLTYDYISAINFIKEETKRYHIFQGMLLTYLKLLKKVSESFQYSINSIYMRKVLCWLLESTFRKIGYKLNTKFLHMLSNGNYSKSYPYYGKIDKIAEYLSNEVTMSKKN